MGGGVRGLGAGLMEGGYAPERWNCALWIISNNGFFFFLVLFSYSHIVFVKVMNVIIFHCILRFIFFCAECSKVIEVSIGPYSFALCRI